MVDYLTIGKVVGAHGIKGEVKILPETDDPERFKRLKTVRVELKGTVKEYKCKGGRIDNNVVLLKLEGIDDRDKAMSLKDALLSVTRENAIKLSEDNFFIADLIGCEVYEEDGNLLGIVKDVFPTGSNDVYEVVNEKGKMMMIPALKKVVKSVDIENGKIIVELLPGLKEIYYEN